MVVASAAARFVCAMTDAPDPSVIELMRREAFEEVGRMSFLADDYALKLFDATEQIGRAHV